jgi:dihydroorotate dehydrogenase subfamily 2
MSTFIKLLLIILAFGGFLDASYLAYENFMQVTPPCTVGMFSDCGKVLQSSYATPFGIPLGFFGMIHYFLFTCMLVASYIKRGVFFEMASVFFSIIGGISSLFFMYLQLGPIGALCLYCVISASISFILFFLTSVLYPNGRVRLVTVSTQFLYIHLLKKILFLFDPERVHVALTDVGFFMGSHTITRKITAFLYRYENKYLSQRIHGISFLNPVGLAAGFDYEANLPSILPSLGFGFGTIGTITATSYEGNQRPMLGRLPKSKSLMVNKGFKNMGARQTIKKLKGIHAKFPFEYPVGISIGRTNTLSLKTQKQSIRDIVRTFTLFEKSTLTHAYYELNISCPNLKGTITFYPPKNLEALLKAVDALKLSRPVFIKMPIEKSNKEITDMLSVISKHSPVGVIFGNLQKDRTHCSLDQDEVSKFPIGNFSGKPCFERSNELISLCYKKYKKRFVIIGCGGIFSAEDAYEKIKRGATLLQFVTGMIYEGPQLASRINQDLAFFIKRDGFLSISDAVGSKH